jgi:hypothetical protein
MKDSLMINEEWSPVPEFESFYIVSNLGKVASLDRQIHYKNGRVSFYKGKTLKGSPDRSGYPRVLLMRNCSRKYIQIHRLVANVFIPNENNLPMVCHRNGIKTDNSVSNLYWGTSQDNNQDTVMHGNNVNSQKTQCPKKHPYSGDNLVVIAGYRRCKECRKDIKRKSYLKKKALTCA